MLRKIDELERNAVQRRPAAAFACAQQKRSHASTPAQVDANLPLSDLAIKRAKPGSKIIKLSDGGGLQLWITLDPAKRWRPGELRGATWAELDLENAAWSLNAERMKIKSAHRVPLAPRAVAILRALRELTRSGKLLFPPVVSAERPMSENTLTASLRRMGFKQAEMSSHGFRASVSSMLNDSGLWNAASAKALSRTSSRSGAAISCS